MNIDVTLEEKVYEVELTEQVIEVSLGEGIPGPPGTGDKTYAQSFSVADTIIVNHNLNKHPAVSVVDSGGTEVYGTITYNSDTQLTVNFSASFSGVVYCN